jgi:hypothetical protein
MSTLGSVIIAIIFLGETIDALQSVGIVLVMIGPAFVAPKRKDGVAASAGGGGTESVADSQVTRVFKPKYV